MKLTMQIMRATSHRKALAVALCASLLLPGCSVKKFAVNKLGDALANGGTTFSSDDDLELIRDAVPFSLMVVVFLIGTLLVTYIPALTTSLPRLLAR